MTLLPPSADKAETALCGGLMLYPERMGEVSALVSIADFRRPDWAQLFALISDTPMIQASLTPAVVDDVVSSLMPAPRLTAQKKM